MPIKNFFLDLSLNKKLIGMMLFLSLILVSVLLFLFSQSERALLTEIENQTAELSKAIQVGVEEVTSSGYTDEMRLQHYLQKLNAKGLKEISIISNTDEIIASTNPMRVGEEVGPKKKEHIIKAELGEPVSKEGKVYNVILPVVAGNEHYGYIHLTINAEDFSEILKSNIIDRIVATSLVFGLGILIAVFLSWMYTRPIHNVVNAARRVAAGDLTLLNVTADRKDEIGELTQSFNFMVQKLREERALEEKLREAEHLSGIAQLAKGIAHEIRNPLNFISLSIDHLRKKFSPREQAEKDAIKIQYYDEGLPRLSLDPELIKTCLFNIILNAFQAMPSGGEITVGSRMSNGTATVIIADTGIGVSRENLSRLFDPFFSTKSTGLGLGLAMTKRVIEDHGGKGDFQTTEGKGSTVTISLPA